MKLLPRYLFLGISLFHATPRFSLGLNNFDHGCFSFICQPENLLCLWGLWKSRRNIHRWNSLKWTSFLKNKHPLQSMCVCSKVVLFQWSRHVLLKAFWMYYKSLRQKLHVTPRKFLVLRDDWHDRSNWWCKSSLWNQEDPSYPFDLFSRLIFVC